VEKLEKLIWIVAGVVVVLVVGFIFLGPLRSDVTTEQALSDFDILNDRMRKERKLLPAPVAQGGKPKQFGGAPAPGTGRTTGGSTTIAKVAQPGQPPTPTPPSEEPSPYTPQGEIPQPAQQDPQIMVGAGYEEPIYIPMSMAEKYKHFDDIRELGMTAAGEDYTTPSGEQAYLLRGINEDSPLASRLGFQPGDIIISVNGYAPSRGNARQLYEALKTAKDFQVVVERAGQRSTKQFNIR